MNAEQIKDKEFYTVIQVKILKELLGWSETQATDWIKCHIKPWEEFHAVYVSEKPEYWVTDALISASQKARLGAAQTSNLKRDIVHALEMGDFAWYKNEAYDWPSARLRIELLKEKYYSD